MNNDLNDYNKELSDKYIENMRTKIKLLYFLKNILIIPFIIALFYWLPYGVMFLIGESSYLMKSLPSFTIMVLSFIGRKYLSYKLSTRWITIAGPKMFNIDMPMYLHNIQNKLIPKLAEKGIVLNYRYSYIQPGEVWFETENIEPRLRICFYNNRIEIINEKNYPYPMFVGVYNATLVDNLIDKDTTGRIGEIDLTTDENVEEAVELIINKINELHKIGYITKIIADYDEN